jgi:RNA recognition motif-containing protein
MEAKLHVGNLAYSTTEADLRTVFSQVGGVTAVAVITDRDSGRSKGFAFVTMATPAEAQKAVSVLDGFALQEHTLKVSLAKPREAPATGAGGRLSAFSGGRQRGHKPRGGNRRY